jgi:hypothetical protein
MAKAAVALGAAVGLTMFASFPSAAVASGSAKESATNKHCAVVLDVKAQRCFPTVQQAKEYAGITTVWTVRFYDWINYNLSGPTYDVYVARDCTATLGDKDFRFASMPSGWNDRVSSLSTQTGAHCDVWLSSDINFEGECGNQWIHVHPDLRQIGCYDRASSFELS